MPVVYGKTYLEKQISASQNVAITTIWVMEKVNMQQQTSDPPTRRPIKEHCRRELNNKKRDCKMESSWTYTMEAIVLAIRLALICSHYNRKTFIKNFLGICVSFRKISDSFASKQASKQARLLHATLANMCVNQCTTSSVFTHLWTFSFFRQ